MKQLNKVKGANGELLAKKQLKKLGYKILEMNYTNKIGEIDIIAKDGDFLVFVEVKTRSSNAFGRPCEAVTPYKQEKIRKVATLYLLENDAYNSNIRFDVVEILDNDFNLIRNAF